MEGIRPGRNSLENENTLNGIIEMKPLNLIAAVVGGAIAGAAVGLLLAPEKGEKTRQNIAEILKRNGISLRREKMEELVDEIEDQLDKTI